MLKILPALILVSLSALTFPATAAGTARHWFTQPMSRLVLNPFMETPAPPGVPEPVLPVHAAYYTGEYPARLPFLWGFVEAGPEVGEPLRALAVSDTASAWAPHEWRETVARPDGGTIEATTVFDGPRGLIQRVRVTGASPRLAVVGMVPEGAAVRWDPKIEAVTWRTPDVAFALVVPGGEWRPTGNARTWAVHLSPDGPEGWSLSARFDGPSTEPMPVLARDAFRRSAPPVFDIVAASEKKAWAERMARIPRPKDFTLRVLPAMGATPEAIRGRYEEAWAFVLSDTLPPMPENGFPYPQVACGKPSLWGEGHPKARASAQWESILGMPYLAVVEPETAWKAFEGMMALVDEEGTMGGEGLPSRHAETAWLLYRRTDDRKRLMDAYPAIKRLLLWKARDPRWMHKGATAEGTKDSEFVTSAMLDMAFAARIAGALDMPKEAAFWKRAQAELAADFRRWFWETPGGDPYEWYDAETGNRWGKDSAWTLESLVLPLPLLGAEQRDSLLRLFRRLRDDEKPFLVPNLTKQPNLSPARDGLALHGKPDEAEAVAESQMRDITLADTFAETYDQERPLHGTGVRPSLFGALNIIDGALFHNGLSLPGRTVNGQPDG